MTEVEIGSVSRASSASTAASSSSISSVAVAVLSLVAAWASIWAIRSPILAKSTVCSFESVPSVMTGLLPALGPSDCSSAAARASRRLLARRCHRCCYVRGQAPQGQNRDGLVAWSGASTGLFLAGLLPAQHFAPHTKPHHPITGSSSTRTM